MKHVSTHRKIILLLIFLVCPAVLFLASVKAIDLMLATGCCLGSLAMMVANLWDVHEDAVDQAKIRVQIARSMMNEGQNTAASECLDMAVALDPNNRDAIVVRGEIYLAEQQYDNAREELLKACEINPGAYRAHYALGLTYLQEKKIAEAIPEIKRAIVLNPEFCESYYFLANAYDQSDEKENALISYRKFQQVVSSDDLKSARISGYLEKTTMRIRRLS